jgi:hypothetical protein
MPKIVFKKVKNSYTSEVNFLGINISNNLKWNTHIQFYVQVKKGILYDPSLRGDLSLFMLRNIYFTKFQSLIRYGILWSGESKCQNTKNTKKGFLVQLKGCIKERLVGQFLKS